MERAVPILPGRTFDLIDPFGNTIFVMGPVADAAPA